MNSVPLKKVTIYSDGACRGNPGPGGYGTVLVYNGVRRELSGGDPETTNNRMEIMGVIIGLEALREPCDVTVVSDSKYVVDAVQKGWLASWQKRGWKKADGKPALNVDLWKRFIAAASEHVVSFSWIKGHAGHEFNERCDQLAVAAAMAAAEETR